MLSKRTVVVNFRRRLAEFLKDELAQFIALYDGIDYSNLAFSYDKEDHSLSFSLNTTFDHNKAVLIFDRVSEDKIRRNPKHWRYQDIAMIELISEEHYDAYFEENPDDFYNLLVSELVKFMGSHVYKTLSKAKDYRVTFVIVDPFEAIDL